MNVFEQNVFGLISKGVAFCFLVAPRGILVDLLSFSFGQLGRSLRCARASWPLVEFFLGLLGLSLRFLWASWPLDEFFLGLLASFELFLGIFRIFNQMAGNVLDYGFSFVELLSMFWGTGYRGRNFVLFLRLSDRWVFDVTSRAGPLKLLSGNFSVNRGLFFGPLLRDYCLQHLRLRHLRGLRKVAKILGVSVCARDHEKTRNF